MSPTADARTGRKAYADCRRDCRNTGVNIQRGLRKVNTLSRHPHQASIQSAIELGQVVFLYKGLDTPVKIRVAHVTVKINQSFFINSKNFRSPPVRNFHFLDLRQQSHRLFDKGFVIHSINLYKDNLKVNKRTTRLLPAPGCGNLGVDFVEGHACSRAALSLPAQFHESLLPGIGGKLLHGPEHTVPLIQFLEHVPVCLNVVELDDSRNLVAGVLA